MPSFRAVFLAALCWLPIASAFANEPASEVIEISGEHELERWALSLRVTPGDEKDAVQGSYVYLHKNVRCEATLTPALPTANTSDDGAYRLQVQLRSGRCVKGCVLIIDRDMRSFNEICGSRSFPAAVTNVSNPPALASLMQRSSERARIAREKARTAEKPVPCTWSRTEWKQGDKLRMWCSATRDGPETEVPVEPTERDRRRWERLWALNTPDPNLPPPIADCTGCNIVKEGRFNGNLVGQTVYEKSGSKFFEIRVLQLTEDSDSNPRSRRIHWLNPANEDSGWNDATAYYSEERMNEVKADLAGQSAGKYESDSDSRTRRGHAAACAMCLDAKSGDDPLEALIPCNACCNSEAAKRFGTPNGACGY